MTGDGQGKSTALVVVNFASAALIDRNFAEIDLESFDAQLYVVDNFSTGAERGIIGTVCERHGWALVTSKKNVGFGQGVNIGVNSAIRDGATAALIVNPDVTMSTQVARDLLEVARTGNVAVCPQINNPKGKPAFVGGDLDLATGLARTSKPVDMSLTTSWISGACLALSADLWRASGGFDPAYFMYWEDIDFSQRCRRAGASLVVRNDLTVIHSVGATQGSGKSALYTYYNCRNRLLYAANWLSATERKQWSKRTLSASYEILRRGNGRRSLFSWSQVNAAVRGSLAGLRILRRSDRRSKGDGS